MFQAILEWLFPTPQICGICQRQLTALGICPDCQEALQVQYHNHGQCQRCGTFGRRAAVCDNCRNWPTYLRGNHALLPYHRQYREAVTNLKFHHKPWLAVAFGEDLARLLPAEIDCLVPVPLHASRLQARGYNQSLLLAQAIAHQRSIPVCEALIKPQLSADQVGLSREARRRNLQNAFVLSVPDVVAGAHVAVVDDIFTTGTTIATCAKVLRAGGAKSVQGITLAAGVR